MSGWGEELPMLVVRATLLGLAGAAVYLALRRRGPVEGARAALAALVVMAGSVALAAAPLPRVWSWPSLEVAAAGGPRTAAPAPAVAVMEPGRNEDAAREPTRGAAPAPAVAITGGADPEVARAAFRDLPMPWMRPDRPAAASPSPEDPTVPAFAGSTEVAAWAGAATTSEKPAASPSRRGLSAWLDRIREGLPSPAPGASSRPALALAPTPAAERSGPASPEPAPTLPTASDIPANPHPRPSSWSLTSALAGAYLAGVLVALARLAVGAWGVERLRRASPVIDDPALNALRDALAAELGLRHGPELRVCEAIGSPAAVGGPWPAVLLPGSWRSWSGPQRRAVLAHELAHVARRDYGAGLLARAGVALHWYHPLAHGLAARLRLEQELAADAAAVPLAGGAAGYLDSLARLVLRRDTPPAPAARLLAHAWSGMLSRRIEMLRSTRIVGPAPAALRWLGYGSLVALGGVLAGLRGPGGGIAGEPSARADLGRQEATAAAASPAPIAEPTGVLSLAHVPDDASLVAAFRPTALMDRPDVRGLYDAMIMGEPEVARIAALVDPAGIEQVTLVFRGSPVAAFAAIEGSSEAALFAADAAVIVRSKAPRDWTATVRSLVPLPVSESRRAGRVYSTLPLGESGLGLAFFQADERTLVVGTPAAVAGMIAPRRPGAAPPWADAWRTAATGDLAVALDVGTLVGPVLPMLQALESADGGEPGLALILGTVGPLWEETEHLVVGLDVADHLGFRLAAVCGDEAGARRVERTLDALLTLGQNSGRRAFAMTRRAAFSGSGKEVLALLPLVNLAEQLLDSATLERTGTSVRLGLESRTDPAALVSLLLSLQ